MYLYPIAMQLRHADAARPIIGFTFLLVFLFLAVPASSQDLQVAGEPEMVVGDESSAYMRPIWSPTGDRIAFTGRNYQGLFVTRLGSDEVVHLSDDPAAGYGAEWSHTGGLILSRVAVQEDMRRDYSVKLFDVDSGAEQVIAGGDDVSRALPRWTTEGSHVYVYGAEEAAVINAGIASKAAGGNGRVALVKDGAVAVASSSDPSPREVHRAEDGDVLRLATSPDGQRVAFEVLGGNLFVMNVDGSALTEIGPGEAARFSPDGQWIVFMRTTDDGYEVTGSDLWAARGDGSSLIQLTQTSDRMEMNPDWSPDGSAIAYDDRGSIYSLTVTR